MILIGLRSVADLKFIFSIRVTSAFVHVRGNKEWVNERLQYLKVRDDSNAHHFQHTRCDAIGSMGRGGDYREKLLNVV